MKEYDHNSIEKKWQKEWAKKKVFKTEDNSKKKKYYILDMFPYVSGEGIHVGHPKGYIATDVISRMKRMQGFNVLHPMGFDAFGLPAENYAIKTKTNPMVSVIKNIDRFKKQLEIIGFDYDWSREVITSDPKFYKWTQWIFLKLLEKGLAFESNEPVNWCPTDKTVLANEDVEDGKCERCGATVEKKPMRQWVLKITDYADRMLQDLDELDWPESIKESQRNWIGRSEGSEISFKIIFKHGQKPAEIPVFTTRADTLYGATFMVLSPEHLWVTLVCREDHKGVLDNQAEVKQYVSFAKIKTEIERTALGKEKTGIELKGVKAVNPATGKEIPIFVADYVISTYGTGAVMGVPAHDERDATFAKKYKLPVVEVVRPQMTDNSNPPRANKPTKVRSNVHAVIYNPTRKAYLTLKWKKFPWNTVVLGGIDDGEDPIKAALREVKEETGFTDLEFKKVLGGTIEAKYFAAHKDENRTAITTGVYFEMKSEKRVEVSQEEKDRFDIVWRKPEDFVPGKMTNSEIVFWIERIKGLESYGGDGVLINSGRFDGQNSNEAKKSITEFVGGKIVTKYKLRDWVFSRQRYWGEPIPVLFEEQGQYSSSVLRERKVVPLKEKDLPLKLPKVKSYEPTGTGESPLADVKNWINVKQGKKILKRESNTMPQWAGSSWYYLRYMDPKNTKALVDKKKDAYWNMVDLYVGGAEHATRHLIYARFWHKFLYDIGVVNHKEPFKRLQNVGLIIASDGRKMSKRFGNVINPDTIIKTFGADSLRMYEMFMGPFDQSVAWGEDNIVGVRRFLERVWKLQSKISKKAKSTTDFERLLHKTIQKVGSDIETMAFNTAVSSMMILVNEMERQKEINQEDFEAFLRVLSPFAPHISEELWHAIGNKNLLVVEEWPQADKKKMIESEVKIVVQVNGKVRGDISLAKGMLENEVFEKSKNIKDIKKWLEGKTIKKVIFIQDRLINFVV